MEKRNGKIDVKREKRHNIEGRWHIYASHQTHAYQFIFVHSIFIEYGGIKAADVDVV